VQVPTATSVIAVPDTVQIAEVVEAKLTARPDDAVALSAGGVVPNGRFDKLPNVIVWLSCVTVKLWLTAAAIA